ncbi:MAG TPA: OmpH family outer membrane protein [Flavisolibacter sp.]|nr:OmpH family outer membrane protein [Flavisolibacter sp.]
MNKFKILLIAAALIFSSSAVMAQKTGYLDVNVVIQIMPDAARIDSLMDKFQADSLGRQFDLLVNDYKYRDSILSSKDTLTMPASVKLQHQQTLQNVAYQIQNWQNISQQYYQAKQNQLLEPVYRKVMTAVQTVAKEKGYTYVYDKSVLIIGPTADDLLPAVAQKLNIKVPPQVPIGVNPAAK